jgi:Fic family protein
VFAPNLTITPTTATALMAIEADRQAILELPINLEVLAGLRETARLVATHYSTQIEGNRLTQAQVAEAIRGAHFPGRERDEAEVRNYYRALEHVEALAGTDGRIDEVEVRRIHGLVWEGRPVPTPYRPGQNVIRDAASGAVVYMPPEADDVPGLMADLVDWLNRQLVTHQLPAPLVGAVTHYQFATIHPYYDGNGRTARLLTTLLLHRAGYGLKGIYSLDEHYARDLAAYYAALTVGPSHNYYMGRAEADISGFVEFFCESMADALGAIRSRVARSVDTDVRDDSVALRTLDPRARRLLELFRRQEIATSAQMAAHLGLSPRTVTQLARRWVQDEVLEIQDPGRRTRSYRLGSRYQHLLR